MFLEGTAVPWRTLAPFPKYFEVPEAGEDKQEIQRMLGMIQIYLAYE